MLFSIRIFTERKYLVQIIRGVRLLYGIYSVCARLKSCSAMELKPHIVRTFTVGGREADSLLTRLKESMATLYSLIGTEMELPITLALFLVETATEHMKQSKAIPQATTIPTAAMF